MNKKINVPKKGAGRRLAARLKELGKQAPPQDLVDVINKKQDKKDEKVAADHQPKKDLDI